MSRAIPNAIEGVVVALPEILDRHDAHHRPGDSVPHRVGIRHRMRVRLNRGFDTRGAINVTVCPWKRPAQSCAPLQATIRGAHGSIRAIKGIGAPRRASATTVPVSFMPTIGNICWAVSVLGTLAGARRRATWSCMVVHETASILGL
jgi:hypothetical protein